MSRAIAASKAHRRAYPHGRPVPTPHIPETVEPPKPDKHERRVSDLEIDRIIASHFRNAPPDEVARQQRKMKDLVQEAAECGDTYTATNVREVLRLVGTVAHYE